MQDVKESIERLEPAPEASGDWDAVMRDARGRRRSLLRPLAGVAVAAGALFGLALFQPWESENPTFLERALAAVDDGPVLHVVLRGDWGGTLVDLETGERTAVHGENEIWYDPERELVRRITRLGGVVQEDLVYEPKEPPQDLVALASEYREALRTGAARVTGEDVIDGERVYWITIRSEMLPDVADGKLHEWAQQVAVSRETAEPVATRETRDGKPGPMTGQRVLELEMLPAEDGDFTGPRKSFHEGLSFAYQPFGGDLTVDKAEEVLGRRPLWSGPRFHGLELARIGLTETRMYRERKQIHEERGVVLFYGELGDDPSTYREAVVPLRDRTHVAITLSSDRPLGVRGVGTKYVPPDGSVFLAAGGRTGYLEVDGLTVTIEASSEGQIISAARALEQMPG